MGSSILLSFVLSLTLSPEIDTKLLGLQNAIERTQEYYSENPLPETADFGDRYYQKQFREELSLLLKRGLIPLNSGEVEVSKTHLDQIHLFVSSLSCNFIFTGPAAQIVDATNALYATQVDRMNEYQELSELIGLATKLRQALPDEANDSRLLISTKRAASDFIVELQNLLFYTPSPKCFKPEDRKPKSLKERLQSSRGFRSPQTRFNLLDFFLERYLKGSPKPEPLQSFDELKAAITTYFAVRSSKIESNERRAKRGVEFYSKFDFLEFELEGLPESSVAQLQVVSEVYDAFGSSWEIHIPVASFDDGFARLNSTRITEAIESFVPLDTLGFPKIRLSIYDSNMNRLGYIDARQKRDIKDLSYYIGFEAAFFPWEGHDSIESLRRTKNRKISSNWEVFELFLEDRSGLEVIPDRILGVDEDGKFGVLGLTYTQAKEYHRRRVEALFVAKNRKLVENLEDLVLHFSLRARAIYN